MILKVTILSLIFDIFSRFDGTSSPIYPILNNIGNFIIFVLNPILPSIWLLYVQNQIFPEESTKQLIYPLLFINIINISIVVLTQFFGWYYYIDFQNIYHRGPMFHLAFFITVIILLSAFVKIVRNRKVLAKNHYISLVFFAIPPFIGAFLQIFIYGVSIVLNSVVLSILIVFLNIQNHSMYTDYLTGVYNRKKLDAYLDEKINLSTQTKTFSAIMIDLNDFKYINDNFGHDMGDVVLQISAKILNSCVRTNDFVARYGGDEFCVVLETHDIKDLEAIINRIQTAVIKFNETSNQPYKLGFSLGYAVYDYETSMTTEEFQRYIDVLMYENKKANNKNQVEFTPNI
jgi:diguanylate cyclase (GGDEF)-like protein